MNTELTPDQKKESDERREAFVKEYTELSKKYQYDIGGAPSLVSAEKPGRYEVALQIGYQDLKYAYPTAVPNEPPEEEGIPA